MQIRQVNKICIISDMMLSCASCAIERLFQEAPPRIVN
jgi:hypothetical protein